VVLGLNRLERLATLGTVLVCVGVGRSRRILEALGTSVKLVIEWRE